MKEIYYWKKTDMMLFFQFNSFGDKIFVPIELKEHYIKMPLETTRSNEEIFNLLNTDGNPLSDKHNQNFIKEEVGHTSMSVGDMIKEGEKWFVAVSTGFAEVIWIKER